MIYYIFIWLGTHLQFLFVLKLVEIKGNECKFKNGDENNAVGHRIAKIWNFRRLEQKKENKNENIPGI